MIVGIKVEGYESVEEADIVGQRLEHKKRQRGIHVQIQIRGINNIDIWSQLYVLYSIDLVVLLPVVISVL